MQMQVSLILYVFRQEKAEGVSQYYGGGGLLFQRLILYHKLKKPEGPENLSDMGSTRG